MICHSGCRNSLIAVVVMIMSVCAGAQSKASPSNPSAAPGHVGSALQTSSEPLAILAGPYIQSPSDNAVTIMWITNRKSDGWVEYKDGATTRKAVGSHDGLLEANTRIHRVTIAGLSSGNIYKYRVFSRDIVDFQPYKVVVGKTVGSAPHSFRTPDRDSEELSFIVFNDVHEHFDQIPALLRSAATHYDFAVFNGDMLSDVQQENQVLSLLRVSSDQFASEHPLIYVRGNHETRGGFARELANYLALPNGRYYYSVDYGPVHFLVLDTGEDKADLHREYSGLTNFDAYRTEEMKWLKEEVNTPAFRNAKYRIVLAHMDFVESDGTEDQHGMRDANEKFGPILKSAGIDMLISGHEHRYKVKPAKPGEQEYCLLRGGGPQAPTITLVSATRNRLRGDMLDLAGTAVGGCQVQPQR